MKIIKEGDKLLGRFSAVLNETFTCKPCGCQFQIERVDIENQKATVADSAMQAGFGWLSTSCPCCGQRFGAYFYIGEFDNDDGEDNGAPYYAS